MSFHSTRWRPRSASALPCPTLPPSSQRRRNPQRRRRFCSWTHPIGMAPPSFGSCWACNCRDRLKWENNPLEPTTTYIKSGSGQAESPSKTKRRRALSHGENDRADNDVGKEKRRALMDQLQDWCPVRLFRSRTRAHCTLVAPSLSFSRTR